MILDYYMLCIEKGVTAYKAEIDDKGYARLILPEGQNHYTKAFILWGLAILKKLPQIQRLIPAPQRYRFTKQEIDVIRKWDNGELDGEENK